MEATSVLLPTAYLPPLPYLRQVLLAEHVQIEVHENFVKQTYRNRCDILTANGKRSLSIPLEKHGDKEPISAKRIAYAENWQQQHWRTISSAYKSSPYFEFFESDFRPFYETRYEFLLEYNTALLKKVLHLLRAKKELTFTDHYEPRPLATDYRAEWPAGPINPYYQVFSIGSDFVPDLSCIDALFNTGLETRIL